MTQGETFLSAGSTGDNVDVLVETAVRVLADPAAYRPLGEAGRRRIEERYSLEVCHPRLKAFFERLAAGRRETES